MKTAEQCFTDLGYRHCYLHMTMCHTAGHICTGIRELV